MFRKLLTGIAISTLVFLASCGPKNHGEDENVFKYNEMGDVTSLDPAAARSLENIWIDNQIYNGLVEIDDSLKIHPCIAKSWDISKGGTLYTFHLRSDVYFQDDSIFPGGKGRKVIAEDFVHSFFRLFDARVSDATTLLGDIDRNFPGTYQGFSAINDSTFSIYLKKPFAPFMNILSMKYFSVVAIEAVDKYGQDYGEHPVGTGPFKLKRWAHGQKLVLTRNANYFEKDAQGNQLPYLDGVVVSFIKDMETSFLEFIDGNYDMVSGIAAINPKEVFTADGKLRKEFTDKIYMQRVPFIKTDYLGFMIDPKRLHDNVPTTIKAIRQAINYTINRDELVRYLRYNVGIPATNGFVPPFLPGNKNSKVEGYTFNPDKANALLSQAGFPNGKGLPEISIFIPDDFSPIAQAIQAQLQRAGMKVNIQRERPAVLAECVVSGQCYFFKKSWVGDYPDAENFLALFYSKNFSPEGVNYFHYSDPKYDSLYESAVAEPVDSIRNREYKTMDEMIMEAAPVVPLYYDEAIHLVNKHISGLPIDPRNYLDLRRAKKVLAE
ncbi:MAG TPA: ABC transporter substrate-binding protein [Bacteroidia bacterium]|nr:ABC transporter substrate-binding protein [Bacteroidia bacterium]